MAVDAAELAEIAALCAVTPTAPLGSPWTGLLSDAHVHTQPGQDVAAFARALLRDMNEAGIERALVQPDHAPDIAKNPGFLGVVRELDESWGRIADRCPRILPLLYGFVPDRADDAAFVRARLDAHRFAGIGEIEFQHSRMDIAWDPRASALDALYPDLQRRGGLLHFQAALNRKPALAEPIAALVREYPGIGFLWFACDGRFAQIDAPNLMCGAFLHRDMPMHDPQLAARSVWGSDTGPRGFDSPSAGALPYRDVWEAAQAARIELAAMEPTIAEAVARGNFDRLLPRR
jgi:hypothetical protein